MIDQNKKTPHSGIPGLPEFILAQFNSSPTLRALCKNLLSPYLDLRQLHLAGDPRKLRQVDLVNALVLHHLEEQLHLVNIVHKLRFERDIILILLEHALDLVGRQRAAGDRAQQCLGDIVHNFGLATRLLGLGHIVDRGDIADEGFGHVVHQSHLGAVRDVEFGCQLGRGKHRHDRHAVHVVGDGFAIDAEAAPAFTLCGLQALKEVEEGNGCRGVLLWRVGEGRQHWQR